MQYYGMLFKWFLKRRDGSASWRWNPRKASLEMLTETAQFRVLTAASVVWSIEVVNPFVDLLPHPDLQSASRAGHSVAVTRESTLTMSEAVDFSSPFSCYVVLYGRLRSTAHCCFQMTERQGLTGLCCDEEMAGEYSGDGCCVSWRWEATLY